jgi:mannitol-1-phosphate/altronate dehydrogenase
MVDRIVPAMTMPSRQELNKNVGTSDKCGVICESFRQWVIEDNFVAGRPEWQLAGATFVNDVVPFEDAKLRLLNGSHTVMAIIGSLMGIDSVNLSMDNPNLRSAIVLFMEEQTCSLRPEFDISVDLYVEALISRFQNPNIKHLLLQIAMDSSQKIPVRIIHPMSLLKKQGSSIRTHIFLLSAWVHFVERFFDDGSFDVKVSDPKSGDLMSLLATRKHYQPTEWCEKVLITSGFFQDRDVLLSELLSDISDGYKSINADGVGGALLGLLSNSTHVQAFKLVKDFNENVNL